METSFRVFKAKRTPRVIAILFCSFTLFSACQSSVEFGQANQIGCDSLEIARQETSFSNPSDELEYRRRVTEAAYYRITQTEMAVETYQLLPCH